MAIGSPLQIGSRSRTAKAFEKTGLYFGVDATWQPAVTERNQLAIQLLGGDRLVGAEFRLNEFRLVLSITHEGGVRYRPKVLQDKLGLRLQQAIAFAWP